MKTMQIKYKNKGRRKLKKEVERSRKKKFEK